MGPSSARRGLAGGHMTIVTWIAEVLAAVIVCGLGVMMYFDVPLRASGTERSGQRHVPD
jgi:hypothetical protein